jgi:hypothetical protein
VHRTAAEAARAADPAAYVRARAAEKKLAAGYTPRSRAAFHADDVQDLFDSVAA